MNELAPHAEPANQLGFAQTTEPRPTVVAEPANAGWPQPPRPRRMPNGPVLAGPTTTVQPSTVQPSTVQPSTVQPSTVQPALSQPPTTENNRRRYPSRAKAPRRRPQGASRDYAGWATLTAAELMVARLVAEGMSNRAVAAALVISPHTVSSHLRSVFSKLDVRTRAQLTRLVVQHEVPHPSCGDPSRRGQDEQMSDDGALLKQVHHLVAREHRLRALLTERHQADRSEHRAALERVEKELDQCWDLLRQRRALRATDQDPNQAQVRPVSQVEGYLPIARDGR